MKFCLSTCPTAVWSAFPSQISAQLIKNALWTKPLTWYKAKITFLPILVLCKDYISLGLLNQLEVWNGKMGFSPCGTEESIRKWRKRGNCFLWDIKDLSDFVSRYLTLCYKGNVLWSLHPLIIKTKTNVLYLTSSADNFSSKGDEGI